MPTSREDQLRVYAIDVTGHLQRAGAALADRQMIGRTNHGNVAPWPGAEDPDFHGTLAAIWVWARAETLGGDSRFAAHIKDAWGFVTSAWPRFIPSAIGSSASDEAAYDCAMVLRAALGGLISAGDQNVAAFVEAAARLLSVYLTDLDDLSGRDFRDPGFLAWNLADYARASEDRGLIASSRRFVDRAFGMKAPAPFVSEPAQGEGLFDFSSTTAMRVMAVLAAEGNTPFIGAWLRERVSASVPRGFCTRALDENAWNACVAIAMGRAFIASTDASFLEVHTAIVRELVKRSRPSGTIGRQPGLEDDTLGTFYLGLALDGLIKG